MAVRNFVRDARGRFSSRGGGTVSRAKKPKPQPKGGSLTRALKAGQTALYKAEQSRMQMLGGNVAGLRLIRQGIRRGADVKRAQMNTSPKPQGATGSVSGALRGTLRQLAQSDARYYRELGTILNTSSGGKAIKGSSKPRRRLKGS